MWSSWAPQAASVLGPRLLLHSQSGNFALLSVPWNRPTAPDLHDSGQQMPAGEQASRCCTHPPDIRGQAWTSCQMYVDTHGHVLPFRACLFYSSFTSQTLRSTSPERPLVIWSQSLPSTHHFFYTILTFSSQRCLQTIISSAHLHLPGSACLSLPCFLSVSLLLACPSDMDPAAFTVTVPQPSIWQWVGTPAIAVTGKQAMSTQKGWKVYLCSLRLLF